MTFFSKIFMVSGVTIAGFFTFSYLMAVEIFSDYIDSPFNPCRSIKTEFQNRSRTIPDGAVLTAAVLKGIYSRLFDIQTRKNRQFATASSPSEIVWPSCRGIQGRH